MISIIIPIVREEKAKKLIQYLKSYKTEIPFEIVCETDWNRIGCPKMVDWLTRKTKFDWVMFLGDDTLPEDGFLEEAVNAVSLLPEFDLYKWGMVGLNDEIHDGNQLATHWMCHKNVLGFTGGEFFHTGYKHQYCDRELIDIAKANNFYVWAEKAKIKHNHFINDKSENDEHYQRAYSAKNAKHDLFLYIKRKYKRSGVSLAIGLPIVDSKIHTQFFLSFSVLDKPRNCQLIFPSTPSGNSDIGVIRNMMCWDALKYGHTHLLMMDTDQIYHDADLIFKLLSHKKDIVGGKVHRRYPPFEPILNIDKKHVDDKIIEKGGLIKVETTGAGCLLINLSCLEGIEEPWFEIKDKKGEDINFCYKAAKAGKKVYVDCDVNIGHLSMIEVDNNLYQLFKKLNMRK